mmetsp:Transcript_2210/g.4722  ORF Transcript_2210/g.4722 Transcript_2210/m.4722 type:complete len:289 (-) Transcript_2210:462-1328(-)
MASNCFVSYSTKNPSAPLINLFLGNELVNDGVQQNSSNSDGAPKHLDGVEGFTQNKSHTDDDNDTLGGVGNGLCDGTGLLQSQGGALVVSVEPKTRGEQVLPDGRGSLCELAEFTESASFLDGDNRERQNESQDCGKGELVSDGSETVPQAGGFHELLVFVTLDSGEHVGYAGRDKGGPGKVKFLDGSQDNSSNNNRKTQPLGLGDGLSVNVLGKDGGKGGFGSLHDLGKGNGSHSHGKDGSGMGSHEAKGNGKHLNQILHGDGGLCSGIGCEPEEETVNCTNSELKR